MTTAFSPSPQLTCDDLLHLKPSLQAYLECFSPVPAPRPSGVLQRLRRGPALSEEQRKSVERMVQHQLESDMNQVRHQYFMAHSPWSDRPFLERHW